MKDKETGLDTVVKATGPAVMVLILGSAGFLLVLAVVAAVVTHNHTLAVLACFLLLAPLLATLLWGLFSFAAALRVKWDVMDKLESETAWNRSQGLRVVYQAYFA
jgi:hypothetical protein